MNDKTLCFTWGLSTQDIESCNLAFSERHPNAMQLNLISINQEILPRHVRDIIHDCSTSPRALGDRRPPEAVSSRVILMHTEERGRITQIMNSFRSVLPNSNDLIFAMITDTAQDWTFQFYLEHLTEEHEYMKRHRPEDNPDMRPM